MKKKKSSTFVIDLAAEEDKDDVKDVKIDDSDGAPLLALDLESEDDAEEITVVFDSRIDTKNSPLPMFTLKNQGAVKRTREKASHGKKTNLKSPQRSGWTKHQRIKSKIDLVFDEVERNLENMFNM